MDEASKFRESQRIKNKEIQMIDISRNNRNAKNQYKRNMNGRTNSSKKVSKKPVEKMKRKIPKTVAAVLLGATIGIGALSVVGNVNNKSEITITQMQENGADLSKLGLENDTLELIEKYDEFFTSFDKDNVNLSQNDVIDMIKEIRGLNYDVIKEKIADKNEIESEDVTLHYDFEKGDGKYYTAIVINEGKYDEIVYNNVNTTFLGNAKENYIPQELSDLIVQIDGYNGLIQDVKNDDISKVNAIKKLSKMYANISDVATSKLTIDEKRNISLEHYEEEKQTEQKSREDEGR